MFCWLSCPGRSVELERFGKDRWLRFVRAHERFRALPVVVLTTRGDEGSREAALREGATRYLTKPFQPATFAPEIRALLGGTAPA